MNITINVGTSASRYSVTTVLTHGLSASTLGSLERHGTSERKIGLIRDRMSGTPVRSLRT